MGTLECWEHAWELGELPAGQLLERSAMVSQLAQLEAKGISLADELNHLVHDAVDDQESTDLNRLASLEEERVCALVVEELVVLALDALVEVLHLVGVDQERLVRSAGGDDAVLGASDPEHPEVSLPVGIFVQEKSTFGEVGVLGCKLDVHARLLEVESVLAIDADDPLLPVAKGSFVHGCQVGLRSA